MMPALDAVLTGPLEFARGYLSLPGGVADGEAVPGAALLRPGVLRGLLDRYTRQFGGADRREPGLAEAQHRVRGGLAVGDRREQAHRRPAEPPGDHRGHLDGERVERVEQGERGAELAVRDAQVQRDRVAADGAEGEQLGAPRGRPLRGELAVREHDALLVQPLAHRVRADRHEVRRVRPGGRGERRRRRGRGGLSRGGRGGLRAHLFATEVLEQGR